jgi:hypothetical protein
MNCDGCGDELEYNYHLKLCDRCLEKRYNPPFATRVEGRFFIFKIVGSALAAFYLYSVFTLGLGNPFEIVPIAISWVCTSAFLSVGLYCILYGRR